MNRAPKLLATALAVALALTASASLAQKKGPKGPAGPTVDLKPIQEQLKSGDAAKIAAGLGDAKKAGAAAQPLAKAIEELLARGASAPVMIGATEALGAIGSGTSSATLHPFVHHRTQDLRRAAVRALGATKGPEAIAAFREGLRSGDAMVRGFSASGLGNLGAHDAIGDLFLALDHGVSEAGAAVGQLCAPEECDRFADKLGKVGFDVMTSGLDPILFRQPPLPEATVIKVVGRLRELGTPESGKYLADVQGRWQPSMSKKVKQAIDTAVQSVPGARDAGDGK